jgi:hypothetical protein
MQEMMRQRMYAIDLHLDFRPKCNTNSDVCEQPQPSLRFTGMVFLPLARVTPNSNRLVVARSP